MSDIKEQSIIKVKVGEIVCPYCSAIQGGFFSDYDPRGEQLECEDCGEFFKVSNNPDIEFGYFG